VELPLGDHLPVPTSEDTPGGSPSGTHLGGTTWSTPLGGPHRRHPLMETFTENQLRGPLLGFLLREPLGAPFKNPVGEPFGDHPWETPLGCQPLGNTQGDTPTGPPPWVHTWGKPLRPHRCGASIARHLLRTPLGEPHLGDSIR
jgi:hypothetical protein